MSPNAASVGLVGVCPPEVAQLLIGQSVLAKNVSAMMVSVVGDIDAGDHNVECVGEHGGCLHALVIDVPESGFTSIQSINSSYFVTVFIAVDACDYDLVFASSSCIRMSMLSVQPVARGECSACQSFARLWMPQYCR